MLKKFPFHRILVLFTLLGVSLTACNATPALTSTAAAKQTPISTQTSEVSPTPTEDPLAGAPEGATKSNGKGGWLKETSEGTFVWSEDAQIFVMSYITPGPTDVDGKVPIVEKKGYRNDGFYFSFNSQEGLAGVPYIGHVKLESPTDSGKALSDQVIIALYNGRSGRTYSDLDMTGVRNAFNTGMIISYVDMFEKEQTVDTKKPSRFFI